MYQYGLQLLDRGGAVTSGAQTHGKLAPKVGIRDAFLESVAQSRDRRMLVAAVIRQNACDLEPRSDTALFAIGLILVECLRVVPPIVWGLTEIFERPRGLAAGAIEDDRTPQGGFGLAVVSCRVLELT